MLLITVASLAEGADQPLEPDHSLFLSYPRILKVRAKHGVDRTSFRNDYILRKRREHLRNDSRTATRHVEDESGRGQSWLRRLPVAQNFNRRLMAKKHIEWMTKCVLDCLVEKGRVK